MTRDSRNKKPAAKRKARSKPRPVKSGKAKALAAKPTPAKTSTWPLQDAQEHFGELVRRARAAGPQRVTINGRDAVVVIAAEAFDKAKPADYGSGADLVNALMNSPLKGVKLNLRRPWPMGRWRDIDL